MKSTLFISLLVLLVSAASGQTSSWSFGAMVSPTIEYRMLYSDGQAIADRVVASRDKNEKMKASYRAGVLTQRTFSNNFEFQTGVMYSNRGFRFPLPDLVFEDQINASSGFTSQTAEQAEPLPKNVWHSFHYLEIPVQVIKSFERDKLNINVGLGTSVDFLIHSSEPYDLNKLNITPTAIAGVGFPLGPSNLNIYGFYRLGVLKLSETPVAAKLWSAGVQFSYFLPKK